MGLRGPKPTPTAILRLRGSWRGNRNPNEPYVKPRAPQIPTDVRQDPDALRVWRRVVPKLAAMDLIGSIDGEAIANYCLLRAMRGRAYAVLAKARTEHPDKPVEQSETGADVVKQILQLTQTCTAIEAQYGMTPSSRSRVATASERQRPQNLPQSPASKYFAAG